MAETILEISEDAEIAGELVYRAMTLSRAKTPGDVAQLIQLTANELLNYIEVCQQAEFKVADGFKSLASNLIGDVREQINLLKNQLGYMTSQIDYCMDSIVGQARSQRSYSHAAANAELQSPADISRSLQRLNQDFDSWRIERRTGGTSLIIRTHPISLYDPRYDVNVEFGQFEISLNLNQLSRGVPKPYSVSALTPNDQVDPNIPHPHVRSSRLCEGNGERPLRRALTNCDILGFALIINQTLCTYNEVSPYRPLAVWSARLPKGPNALPNRSNMSYDEGVRAARLLHNQGQQPNQVSSPAGWQQIPTPPFGADEDDESEDDNLDGVPECDNCGDESPNDLYACDQCGRSVCDNCIQHCMNSERSLCERCVSEYIRQGISCDEDCEYYNDDSCLVRRVESQQNRQRSICRSCGSETVNTSCRPGVRYCNVCRNDVLASHSLCAGCSGALAGSAEFCVFRQNGIDPTLLPPRESWPRRTSIPAVAPVETGFGPPATNSNAPAFTSTPHTVSIIGGTPYQVESAPGGNTGLTGNTGDTGTAAPTIAENTHGTDAPPF